MTNKENRLQNDQSSVLENARTELKELIQQAGSEEKAARLILSVKGASPTSSALNKAKHGSGTLYVLKSYVTDLRIALKERNSH
ncbi:hypothetical protein A1QO_04025 [Vibrio genomosp. F10 str. ZF-129]|uniref:Uncharacterized protein n=1 Tax=Vibrio genomosp. F10 str. ZF-129 TaxID=1187848 RepID=A0A1E5BIK9_9VIBR|nr:hypothetical protein [Vibrio genomosp. F10]OEE37279.1 hypothetical protein A1QO_04025 [Vibrio genomosp. F10 str. ZF-129]